MTVNDAFDRRSFIEPKWSFRMGGTVETTATASSAFTVQWTHGRDLGLAEVRVWLASLPARETAPGSGSSIPAHDAVLEIESQPVQGQGAGP